ncbi:MAG: DUF1684 domain-containing protein [Bacteroidetes bacterium]|nr:DUF1684 domain-containing protein [Bacteroidota bacterium]
MRFVLLFILALWVSACSIEQKDTLPEGYFKELESWKQNRDTRLRSEFSFVNLVGLHWLKQGENSFGSSGDNDIVFPKKAPGQIGSINLQDSILTFSAGSGAEVMIDSLIATEAVVYSASEGVNPVMSSGSFKWHIIERAGNYGIRLRDLEHPRVLEPLNIQYYDWSADWRIMAEFVPYETPQTIEIENIVGFSFDEEIHGEIVFQVEGQSYSIMPLLVDEGFFILFADATSGDETYGAGRYMVADRPDEEGKVMLDFNKAYNPPCAFTDFATCPLPPRENILEIPIIAGEKAWH